jgi:transcription initiation factor TFIIIB Brf1 subunit/transcription initiation factor TFIIB
LLTGKKPDTVAGAALYIASLLYRSEEDHVTLEQISQSVKVRAPTIKLAYSDLYKTLQVILPEFVDFNFAMGVLPHPDTL